MAKGAGAVGGPEDGEFWARQRQSIGFLGGGFQDFTCLSFFRWVTGGMFDLGCDVMEDLDNEYARHVFAINSTFPDQFIKGGEKPWKNRLSGLPASSALSRRFCMCLLSRDLKSRRKTARSIMVEAHQVTCRRSKASGRKDLKGPNEGCGPKPPPIKALLRASGRSARVRFDWRLHIGPEYILLNK